MADSKELEMQRLKRAVDSSLETLRPFRETRRALLKEYAGHKYGKNAALKPVYLNLLKMTASAYLMALSANNPRASISTENDTIKPFAFRFQQSLNRLIKRINLKVSIDRSILDAYFGIGIVKVCLADGFEVEIENQRYDVGFPSAKPVSLEDWVHDAGAQEWSEIQFCGHRYRAPLELVRKDRRFNKDATKDLQPTSKYPRGAHDSAQMMADDCDRDEIEEMVDLWEIWIPRTNRIVTVAAESDGQGVTTKKLADQEWKGPENGPYHFLTFDDVPDNTMPVPPAYDLYELHMLANRLLRKQSRQAGRQKDIYFYKGSAEDTAARMLTTPDGQGCKTEDPDGIKFVKQGGVDPGNFNFTQSVRDLANEVAGNLQALLGLGPMSGTAGQDRMINENVGQKIAKMQARVTSFTTDICRDLGWLMWDHEGLVIPGREDLGGGMSHDTSWSPGNRRGMFIDHQISVEPYSQAYQSPGDKAKSVMSYVQGVILPAMPMLMQQGGSINWQKLNRMMAEYENLPELEDIIDWAEPLNDRDQGGATGPSHQMMKPANTNRTVTRVNGGGAKQPLQMPMAMPAATGVPA
mgnify:CR=1 FL=1